MQGNIMASSLTEFLQIIKKNNIAKTNRFRISFSLPDKLGFALIQGGTDLTALQKQISLTCLITDIPGVQQQTSNYSNGNYNRKIVYSRATGDFNTSFLVTGNYSEKKLFDAWNSIINDESKMAVEFYEEYISNILLESLNEQDQVVYSCQITEAYPLSVSTLKLDRTGQNQQMVLDVNWAYHRIILNNNSNNATSKPSVVNSRAVNVAAIASGKKRLFEIPGIGSLSSSLQGYMNTVKEFRGQVKGVLDITKDVREQVRDFKMGVIDGVKVLNGVVRDIREIRNVPIAVKNELTSVVTDTRNQLGYLKNDTKLIGNPYPSR